MKIAIVLPSAHWTQPWDDHFAADMVITSVFGCPKGDEEFLLRCPCCLQHTNDTDPFLILTLPCCEQSAMPSSIRSRTFAPVRL